MKSRFIRWLMRQPEVQEELRQSKQTAEIKERELLIGRMNSVAQHVREFERSESKP